MIHYEEADAELLPFAAASFDIAVSWDLLWTLPHPERAMDEWIRVLRPGRRLIVFDSQADVSTSPEGLDNACSSPEYEAIGDRLPFVSGRRSERVESSSRHISSSTSPATRSPISSPRKSGAWRRKGSNGASAAAMPSGATGRAKAKSYQRKIRHAAIVEARRTNGSRTRKDRLPVRAHPRSG